MIVHCKIDCKVVRGACTRAPIYLNLPQLSHNRVLIESRPPSIFLIFGADGYLIRFYAYSSHYAKARSATRGLDEKTR